MLTIALLWYWWQERNRGNHGECRATTEEFQYDIRFHVNEWKEFVDSKPAVLNTTVDCSWVPPPLNTMKINIDGAYSAQAGGGGWGLICRDATREILFAVGGSSSAMASALHAETTALLTSCVNLADQIGVGRVEFETDYLVLNKLCLLILMIGLLLDKPLENSSLGLLHVLSKLV
ncbi:hypothetical protein VPH35_104710 [Triticum aestivum]